MRRGDVLHDLYALDEIHSRKDRRIAMTPRLEYLYDYPIKDVTNDENSVILVFDNGATVKCNDIDPVYVATAELVGKQLLTTTFSEDQVVMIFGNVVKNKIENQVQIPVAPLNYSITDPRFPASPSHSPHEVNEATAAPSIREQFDALSDRAAEAPESPQDGEETSEAGETTPEAPEAVEQPHEPLPQIDLPSTRHFEEL